MEVVATKMTIAIITSNRIHFNETIRNMGLPWRVVRLGESAECGTIRFVRVEHEDGCRGRTFDGFIQLDVIDEQTAEQIMRSTRRQIGS